MDVVAEGAKLGGDLLKRPTTEAGTGDEHDRP
jgi:hypothetical protein